MSTRFLIWSARVEPAQTLDAAAGSSASFHHTTAFYRAL